MKKEGGSSAVAAAASAFSAATVVTGSSGGGGGGGLAAPQGAPARRSSAPSDPGLNLTVPGTGWIESAGWRKKFLHVHIFPTLFCPLTYRQSCPRQP